MRNVIIEVRGGVVVEIYSDSSDTRITLIDWDEADEDEDSRAGIEWRPSRLDEMPPDTDAEFRKVLTAADPCEIVCVATPKG
jgi:hypothetical protein